eukprot:4836621-Lingulodinium_polyedra.AAC.1
MIGAPISPGPSRSQRQRAPATRPPTPVEAGASASRAAMPRRPLGRPRPPDKTLRAVRGAAAGCDRRI